jgi:hypothetical protein
MSKRSAAFAFASPGPARRPLQPLDPNSIPRPVNVDDELLADLPWSDTDYNALSLLAPEGPNPLPPPLSARSAACRDYDRLRTHLQTLFRAFYDTRPNHSIFGQPTKDRIKLPLTVPRKSGQSWYNVCARIAGWVQDFDGNRATFRFEGQCWMSKATSNKISIRGPGTPPAWTKEVLATRLLCFITNPTDDNWSKFAVIDPITWPFSHACNRGMARASIQEGICLNGCFHGRFERQRTNEDRKDCIRSCCALCPGHGSESQALTECIFTHPDGTLQPCRNTDDHLPVCIHTPPCYKPKS